MIGLNIMRNRGDQKAMKPNWHNPASKFFFSILLAALIVIPQASGASGYDLNHNPQSYILKKLESHDIVFYGPQLNPISLLSQTI